MTIQERLNNIESLNYEEKQRLVKDIKKEFNINLGYVDKHNRVIKCNSYDSLKANLYIGSQFNMGTKLVIQ